MGKFFQIIFRSTSESSEEMHQNYFLFGIFSFLRAIISEIKYFNPRKTRNTKDKINDVKNVVLEFFLHQYLLFFNIILLFILIILEKVNLSTHLLVGVKLLIELSLTVVHIFGIISLKMFPQMFHTSVLKI